jgi:hypothetical protein
VLASRTRSSSLTLSSNVLNALQVTEGEVLEPTLGKEDGSGGSSWGGYEGCNVANGGGGGNIGACIGMLSVKVRPEKAQRLKVAWKSTEGTRSGTLYVLIAARPIASRSISSRKLIYHRKFLTHQLQRRSCVARLEANACAVSSKEHNSKWVSSFVADSILSFIT